MLNKLSKSCSWTPSRPYVTGLPIRRLGRLAAHQTLSSARALRCLTAAVATRGRSQPALGVGLSRLRARRAFTRFSLSVPLIVYLTGGGCVGDQGV